MWKNGPLAGRPDDLVGATSELYTQLVTAISSFAGIGPMYVTVLGSVQTAGGRGGGGGLARPGQPPPPPPPPAQMVVEIMLRGDGTMRVILPFCTAVFCPYRFSTTL